MTDAKSDLVIPNHHAGHPGFAGAFGVVAGLSMLWGRGAVARVAADLAEVTDKDHVVDVGCGPGTAVREARRRGARVTGVDPAPVMLTLARAVTPRRDRVTWSSGVAEALPLPDASASVYWSISTVHHWNDVEQGLLEARRVLEPEGRLLVIERRVGQGATGHAGARVDDRSGRHVCSPVRRGRIRVGDDRDVRTWPRSGGRRSSDPLAR